MTFLKHFLEICLDNYVSIINCPNKIMRVLKNNHLELKWNRTINGASTSSRNT
jgi:hypothetical protein